MRGRCDDDAHGEKGGAGLMDVKTATVTGAEDNRVRVKFAADEKPSTLLYAVLASYTPAVGDRVLMLQTNTSYICLGAVRG